MSTASEEILARYKKREIETDEFGRAITVRRLRPAEQVTLMRMADTEVAQAINAMTVGAAVCKIDDLDYTFPRSVGELDAVLNVLDEEGLAAATKAYIRIQGLNKDAPESVTEAAKNSQATAS
ncbi:hypothetical protein MKK88_01145 [Methylobacterium sp. E-005]|uniref:hypothetical protein n=1 Tax=Methylobacterium sp. E-005 TaxID=2836549 RepID=UPI001FBBB10C|nr:hypothetical protein [Methylobacterium sp. E-005]MCJ2084602.1 hypothetical protein [Methylobacterium sp. E-005]